MKLKNYFIALVPILILSVSGCKGGTSLSDRRVPVVNKQYLDKEKSISEERAHGNKSDENYYAFNSYQLPVNYFEEKPHTEVFHDSPKKVKKKKPAKIYRKYPKKGHGDIYRDKRHEVKKQDRQKHKEDKKSIVKVKPKEEIKKQKSSNKEAVSRKKEPATKQKVRVLKPQKPSSKADKRLDSPKKLLKHQGPDSKKPKYDPIEWPNEKGFPSKLQLEKDIAYLEQDMIKKEGSNMVKLKPKSSAPKTQKEDHDNGAINTYDVESRPIPLPFK